MKRRHAHPIALLEMTSRYLILLLLPLLQTLVMAVRAWRADLLFSWFGSALTTLCTVAVILLLAFWRWYRFTFAFGATGLDARCGVLVRQSWQIPYPQVTALLIAQPWYLRPFSAVHLQLDTNGGRRTATDFSLTVPQKIAQELLITAKSGSGSTACHHLQARGWTIIGFSLLHGNLLAGMLYLLLAAVNLYRVIGLDLTPYLVDQVGQMVTLLRFIPPFVALVLVLLAVPFCSSFLKNLLSFWRFSVQRQGKNLAVSSGLLTHYQTMINLDQINALLFKQGVVTRLFGIGSAWILCTGYGMKTGRRNLLWPSCLQTTMTHHLQQLLPTFVYHRPNIRPTRRQRGRFLFAPCAVLVVWAGCIGGLWWLFARFEQSVLTLGVIACLPMLWWLGCRIYGYHFTGVNMGKESITCQYTRGFELIEARIPRSKISKMTLSQNPLQRMDGSCHLTIHLQGEQRRRIKVKNLPYTPLTQQ